MRHTVLVPAWRRADMLHACLERLARAVTRDVQVVVSLDRGHLASCREVVRSFGGRMPVVYLRLMRHHRFHGNSYNVLSGLRACLDNGSDLIHVVEDDVFVARGYFAFHEAAHEVAPDAFAVSACKNQNLAGPPPAAAYRHASYQSLGVSLRAEVVRRIVEHDQPTYYGDMVGYCKTVFPGSALPPGHTEQDGLINRIREQVEGVTVYPERPRAFHAGFYGYNRGGTRLTQGTVPERAARILAMSGPEMNALAGDIKDHEPIDLDENLAVEDEIKALLEQA